MNRKEFLKRVSMLCLGAGLTSSIAELLTRSKVHADIPLHEALYYRNIDESTVQCQLCPRGCTLSEGQRSFCRVREPRKGKLYTHAYGRVCSAHIDPIEKKPLFHFLPATGVFSIATAGCNFRCKYCQNWQISQFTPEEVENMDLPPQGVVDKARGGNCPTIAYTYTEPSIFYEYMLDTAKLAKSAGVRNMYHSNGCLNPQAVEELSMYLDAADIDLKGFTKEFYTDIAAGYLDTTLDTLKILKKNKVWLEITTLIVPTLNDDMGKIREMSSWIFDNLGPDVPVHFSRFQPQYKLVSLYPTPVETLTRARETAMAAGLRYVYLGNVPGDLAENTYCHNCKKAIIRRSGYIVLENSIDKGKCGFCGTEIPGVWS
ncbi:MAG: AmmeMemoRadiSam system radical SAM enzyme [Candidatus Omnitrophota bacterium]